MSEQETRPTNGQQPTGEHQKSRHRRGGRGRHHNNKGNQKQAPQAGQAQQPSAQAQPAQKPSEATQQHPATQGGQSGATHHKNRRRRRRGNGGTKQGAQVDTAPPVSEPTVAVTQTEPVAAAPLQMQYSSPSSFSGHTSSSSSFDPEWELSPDTLAITEERPITGGRNLDPAQAVTVVGIRFREHGKIYYFDPQDLDLSKEIHVIVDTANGDSYGFVATIPHQVDQKELTAPLRPVLRVATEEEKKTYKQNRHLEVDAYNACVERIAMHRLPMKLIDVECPFDKSKLLFFFTTPEERVDFRELVKELAGIFRMRIEMRQIGIRDEARKLGGLGICGRPFCCSSFLSNFAQVTIKMAKEQNLALNAAKISGSCGRLMCCLRYEHEVYEEEIKLTPKVDSIVATPDGNAMVVESAPLQGLVKVRFLQNPDAPPKQYVREDVRVIGSKKKGITEPQSTEEAPKE